jgi:hypothetical protein
MHYPEARFYIRRIRLSINSELLKPLKRAKYRMEPAVDAPNDVRHLMHAPLFAILFLPLHCMCLLPTLDDGCGSAD